MQTLYKVVIYTCCSILFSSCEFNCSIGKNKDEPESSQRVPASGKEKNGTVITNNIFLESKGFKIKKATLLLPNRSQVPDNNLVGLNQNIKLVLDIDAGWNLKDGKAFVGASEKITTDGGQTIVDKGDLFADYSTTGFNAEDAKVVSLSAVITSGDNGINYYVVNFRVWDKNGDGEIRGHYKFFIKH